MGVEPRKISGMSIRCPVPVYLPSVYFMAIAIEVGDLQTGRMEMKCVTEGLFSRDQRDT